MNLEGPKGPLVPNWLVLGVIRSIEMGPTHRRRTRLLWRGKGTTRHEYIGKRKSFFLINRLITIVLTLVVLQRCKDVLLPDKQEKQKVF